MKTALSSPMFAALLRENSSKKCVKKMRRNMELRQTMFHHALFAAKGDSPFHDLPT
jgi:hypothetical protein